MVGISATLFNQQLAILNTAVREAGKLADSAKVVQRTKAQKRLGLTVYCNLTAKAESIHTLAQSGKYAGMEIIARSLYENYADLVNIYRYPQNYVDYMFYLSAEQQRSALQAILNFPDSQYSQTILKNAPSQVGLTVEQMLTASKAELQEHARKLTAQYRVPNKNRKPKDRRVDTRVSRRFELAGLNDEYQAIYKMFSKSIHSDIGSMLSAVIQGDDFIWPPAKVRPSSLVVGLVTKIVIDASLTMSSKLKKPKKPFTELANRLDRWEERASRALNVQKGSP